MCEDRFRINPQMTESETGGGGGEYVKNDSNL